MAYVQHTINSWDEIPPHVVNAAINAGWENPSENKIIIPEGMGVLIKTETATLTLFGDSYSDEMHYTTIGAAETPTKLHIFYRDPDSSDNGPQSQFLAGVVEFGYNQYRHFYMGQVRKTGEYRSMGILSSNACTNKTWNNNANRFLLASRNNTSNNNNAGGMDIIDPLGTRTTSDERWARFGMLASFQSAEGKDIIDNRIIGGGLDSINTVEMYQGKSAFSGQNILAPINLYLTEGQGSDDPDNDTLLLRPLGRANGVRMINLTDIDTDVSIQTGNGVWHTFAEFSRQADRVVTAGKTSFYLGLAYRER